MKLDLYHVSVSVKGEKGSGYYWAIIATDRPDEIGERFVLQSHELRDWPKNCEVQRRPLYAVREGTRPFIVDYGSFKN